MALKSRTNLILRAIVDRIQNLPNLPPEILGAGSSVTVDTSFIHPDKSSYTINHEFMDADFQVQIADELFTEISDHEPHKNQASAGDPITAVSGYRVDSLIRVMYYHLNKDNEADTTQEKAWEVSGYVTSSILAMDFEDIFTEDFDETGDDDYFVESVNIRRRTVLENKTGSRYMIPIQHTFSVVYYSGGELAIKVTP